MGGARGMKLLETFTTSNELFFEKLGLDSKALSFDTYFENGVRVIFDTNTGLYWEVKSPEAGDVNYCMDTYTFKEANEAYIQKLNIAQYGGFEDWRMPNMDELRSILDYGMDDIAIDLNVFENCQIGDYWSKNVFRKQPCFGWVFFLGFGSAIAKSLETKHFVMACRGGNDRRFGEADSSRFKDNGDGTITDETTGLMWQKGENQRTGVEAAEMSCSEMDLAGFHDWRLPNIKEINTIQDLSYDNNSWFFDEMFPAEGASGMLHYSSSTMFRNYYAWVTNFSMGYDGYYGGRQAPLLYRAVRSTESDISKGKQFVITHTGEDRVFDIEGNRIKVGEFGGLDAERITVTMSFERLYSGAIIKDKNTGLIWDNAHDDWSLTYEEAEVFVAEMNQQRYHGYADWRLPLREEFRSLLFYDSRIPAIDTTYFTGAKADMYWVGQDNKQDSSLSWTFYCGYGCAIICPKTEKARVRMVRGNHSKNNFLLPAKERFMINGDGTVSDKLTGLMWMQGETPLLALTEALEYCCKLNLGGFSDWYLPNIKELGTIVNLTEGDNWFFTDVFPDTNIAPQGFYLSTTTFDATFGWGCNFQFGFDGYYAERKDGKYPFRPVRKI